jgi:hypothetical protein
MDLILRLQSYSEAFSTRDVHPDQLDSLHAMARMNSKLYFDAKLRYSKFLKEDLKDVMYIKDYLLIRSLPYDRTMGPKGTKR